jgi:DNA-binding PadR family transcriptional regulator
MPHVPNTSPQTLAVLDVLLASGKTWRHGYDLARECDLKSGTLYPLLARLSDQGLLESRWETAEGGRPRHLYRLTTQGAATAKGLLRGTRVGAKRLKLRVRNA